MWWGCCCGEIECMTCDSASHEWDITLSNITENPGCSVQNCSELHQTFTLSFYGSQRFDTTPATRECIWLLEFDQITFCQSFGGDYHTDRIVFRAQYNEGSGNTTFYVMLQFSDNTPDPWTFAGVTWTHTESGLVDCTDSGIFPLALDETDLQGTYPGCRFHTTSDVLIEVA